MATANVTLEGNATVAGFEGVHIPVWGWNVINPDPDYDAALFYSFRAVQDNGAVLKITNLSLAMATALLEKARTERVWRAWVEYAPLGIRLKIN